MAYSLFNSSAASNYLASFKPAKPVDGFDDVLSTDATNNITELQKLDYSGRIGLAKQALVELNAKLQNDALIDYYDRRDDKLMKIEKRKQLASLLGGGGIGSKKSGLAATNDFNTRVDNMYAGGDAQGKIGADLNQKVQEAVNNLILGTGKSPAQVQTNTGTNFKLDPPKVDLLSEEGTQGVMTLIDSFKQPTNNKK